MANPDEHPITRSAPLTIAGAGDSVNKAAIAEQRKANPRAFDSEPIPENLSDGRKTGVRERLEFDADGSPSGSTLHSGQTAAPTPEPEASS